MRTKVGRYFLASAAGVFLDSWVGEEGTGVSVLLLLLRERLHVAVKEEVVPVCIVVSLG